MADLKQFLLPDVGEGLTEAEIIKWDVAPGDTVTVNQTLVEIETAKAAVELPSPYAGVVTALHAAPGDTVDVGRPIITIDIAPDGAPTGTAPADESSSSTGSASEGRQAVLVGYGPKADGPGRRRSRVGYAVAPDPAWSERADADATDDTVDSADIVNAVEPRSTPTRRSRRRYWRSRPSGCWPRNSASTSARSVRPGPTARCRGPTSNWRPTARRTAPMAQRGPRGQRETRVPVQGVRKHMAAAMVTSAFTAPHVTVFQTVDVSAMMQLRERIAARPEFSGVKVSPLLLVAKAVLIAAAATPEINATWDDASRRDRAQALRQSRHRGGYAPRAGRAQHQGRRPVEPARARGRPRRADRDGARRSHDSGRR